MSEIGLSLIKLSDSVEFLCIRAYQPLPYKVAIVDQASVARMKYETPASKDKSKD